MDFSIEAFNGLTQGVGNTATAIKEAASGLATIKTLLNAPKRRSDAEIEAAMNEVALAMENAQLNNRLLEAQVELLMQKVRAAQQAQAKLDEYALYRTPAGGLVYALKNPEGAADGGHLICPDCYEDGRRSILQVGEFMGACGRCGRAFAVKLSGQNPLPPAGWMSR